MTKERIIIGGVVSLVLIGILFAAGATDALYIVVSITLFLAAAGYAAWCEKL